MKGGASADKEEEGKLRCAMGTVAGLPVEVETDVEAVREPKTGVAAIGATGMGKNCAGFAFAFAFALDLGRKDLSLTAFMT